MGEKPQKLQSGRGGGASSGRTSEKTTIIRPGVVTREFSSGGVVHKGNLWLVRATSPSVLFPKVHWTLPKGLIDKGESPEETATREVKEETGVGGRIVKKIGTTKYFYKHPENGLMFKFVTFFLMDYVEDLPDGHDEETSEVAWLPFEEAYKKLSFGGEKQILKKASEALLVL